MIDKIIIKKFKDFKKIGLTKKQAFTAIRRNTTLIQAAENLGLVVRNLIVVDPILDIQFQIVAKNGTVFNCFNNQIDE